MLLFEEKLDRSTPIPLYFQLKSLLLDDIKSGQFKIGEPIPTENELTSYYGISRSTVRQAISELVQEGYLHRVASKGSFVTSPSQSSSFIRSFEPFYQQISHLGKTPRTELIDLKVVSAPSDIAQKLHISTDDKIISMFRRRFADEVPMVTIKNYIPYNLCSYILSSDFESNSLYELLMKNQLTKINETSTIVSSEVATTVDIKLLEVKLAAPILCFNNISTTIDGTVIDYAFARYRGDLNKFEFIDSPRER